MRHLIAALTMTFLLVVSAAAYAQSQSQPQPQTQPQSLGELAKKEKERREATNSQSQSQPQSQKPPQPQTQPQTQPQPQAQPQSLGELARKEKERRAKVTAAGKPITNDDTGRFRSTSVAPATKPAAPDAEKKNAEEAVAQPTAETAPKSDEPVDLQGRPESFWRQAFSDARQKVKELDDEANVLILKLNDLQNQFYREANGFRQQEIQKEIQKTLYEQDKNKEELQKAKDALSDLEKEARKSGALPGWFSGKNP